MLLVLDLDETLIYSNEVPIGREHERLQYPGWAHQAAPLFERAVERDPDFASGWAALALAQLQRASNALEAPAAAAAARASLRRALSIDPLHLLPTSRGRCGGGNFPCEPQQVDDRHDAQNVMRRWKALE